MPFMAYLFINYFAGVIGDFFIGLVRLSYLYDKAPKKWLGFRFFADKKVPYNPSKIIDK